MATPQRNLIIERMVTLFEAITVANGYKTEIGTVTREIFDEETVKAEGDFPFICFRPGKTVYEYQPGDCVRGVMRFDIVFHVSSTTAALISDAVSDLEDDIWKALSDGQLNSAGATTLATSTKVLDFDTNEGNPDTMTGSGLIVAEVVYYRTTRGT